MIAKVTEEYRAVAPSGRVVSTFGTPELAKQWRVTHKQHSVAMLRVLTITVTETVDELQ